MDLKYKNLCKNDNKIQKNRSKITKNVEKEMKFGQKSINLFETWEKF